MARRSPSKYNFAKLMFDETILKKNFRTRSNRHVQYFVIHHAVIRDTDPDSPDGLDRLFDVFNQRGVSTHYGIDGEFVRQYVWDSNIAFAAGHNAANERGIHIELINKTLDLPGTKDDYLIGDKTLRTAARVVANGHVLKKLGRPSSKTIRKHKEFKATACPGPHMERIWNEFIREVRDIYDELVGAPKPPSLDPVPGPSKTIDQVADEVIKGKWGNGQDRIARLTKAGHNPSKVQARVNDILKAPAKPKVKSTSELADEVLQGLHGNGDDRKKSLGARYSEVQAEVNRRLR